MDATPEYIKMCEKAAKDIGPLHGFVKIDDIYVHNGKAYMPYRRKKGSIPEEAVWLPRQDQLQEMVLGGASPYVKDDVWPFFVFLDEDRGKYLSKINRGSWEQCWLAFVMKEKFGKKWTGDEWVTV